MTTEANFPLQQLCLKPSLYGRFSLDHLWPLLGDHQGGNLHALFNGNHNAAAFYPRRGYQTPAKSGSR
jgi:hypothetical protein